MSNRKPHTVYFNDHLRGRVDEMAENSNLSRADIYDEALEFFFAHYEISPEGNLTYNDDYRDMIGESTEEKREMLETILENQREMMESLEAPLHGSENLGQNKNSQKTESTSDSDEIKVRDGFEELRAEYDHDECINPGEVNPDRIKKTRDIRVPVLVGILNWMVEEKTKKRMEKSELVDLAETELEVSRQSARNYVDELDRRGVIHPHPSIDRDLIDQRENIIMTAASATMKQDMGGFRISDLDSTRKKRYDKNLSEYVDEWMEWDVDEYYLSSDAYVSDVWVIIKSAAQEIANTTNKTNRQRDKTRLNQKERVFATSRLLVILYR